MLRKENTIIKSVKFPVGGGLDIQYYTELKSGLDTTQIARGFATPEDVDLNRFVDEFKIHVIRDNYLMGIGILGVEVEDFDVDQRTTLDELLRKIHIDKIIIGGKGQNVVKIVARMDGLIGNIKIYQAGQFKLQGVSYAYAEDLLQSLDNLLDALVKLLNRIDLGIKEQDHEES